MTNNLEEEFDKDFGFVSDDFQQDATILRNKILDFISRHKAIWEREERERLVKEIEKMRKGLIS